MKNKVRKVVIPVAGFGTRFLPFTKAIPKEMLPIINVPLINMVVKEAQDSGIKNIIFVTSKDKPAIEKNFHHNFRLNRQLKRHHKIDVYNQLIKEFSGLTINFVYQKKQLGLGHAILMARSKIQDEPFAVMLGDELIYNHPPVLKQCLDAFYKTGKCILGVGDVKKSDVEKYGIVKPTTTITKKTFSIKDVIEKPKMNDAPSTKAILGRYIFKPQIFDYLEKTKPSVGNEIQLTDAIKAMLKDYPYAAYSFDGKRYDFGTKFGFLAANIDFGLKDDSVKDRLQCYLKKIIHSN